MSHPSSEQSEFKPAASHNPLSASEPWNLVADGYAETTMPALKMPLTSDAWLGIG